MFELSPYPGWEPPRSDQAHKGDCMRRALACVVGVHPNAIPWIDPIANRGERFWSMYQCAAAELGFELSLMWPWPRFRYEARAWRSVLRPAGLWIGVVPDVGRNLHAVVFDGDSFHFGEQHRKRHPNKLWAICTVTPIGGGA